MLPGKSLTPPDLIVLARRYFWLLVLPPAVTFFAALVYSSRIVNVYQSDMLIAVDPQRVPEGFVQSTVTLTAEQRLDAIAVQVLSRTTLEQLIVSLDLYVWERQHKPMEDVVVAMRRQISLEPERGRQSGRDGLDAFHVRFTHHDPQVAAQVTQRLGSLFVDQNTRDRTSRAESTSNFLESQLGEARQLLEAQERRLEAFRERHGNSLPTQMQNNLQAAASAQMQVQSLVESTARDRDRRQMLERLLREATDAPVPTRLSSGAASEAEMTPAQRLELARARLAELEQRYTVNHPDVVRARRTVAELTAAAAAGSGSAAKAKLESEPEVRRRERLAEMQAEIESLDRQIAFKTTEERRLRSEILEYQRRVEAVPGLETEWIALTRDYETQQATYKALLAKSDSSKVSMALEQQQIGEHLRIVDPAGVPVHPLPSVRMRINAMGLAFGLAIGIGLTAFLAFRDTTFQTDSDVIDIIGLPVLALIPRIETQQEKSRRRRRSIWLSVAGAVCLAGAAYVTWTFRLWNSIV